MGKIKTILQIFSTRSGNALTKVRINRLIAKEEELQEIFSSARSSISSIKILVIRQRLRLCTLTRRFARSMPQLQVLYSAEEDVLEVSIKLFADKHSELWYFRADFLEDLQEQDTKWLCHLRSLSFVGTRSGRDLLSLLKACRANLEHLFLGLVPQDENQKELDQITLNALSSLQLNSGPLGELSCFPSLKTPALATLCCRLKHLQKVEFLSLRIMNLMLEDEGRDQWLDEGEGGGEERQGTKFIESFQSTFRQVASIKALVLEGVSSKFQVQLQSILQMLSLCSEADSKEVLLPNLILLHIHKVDESYDFEQLARAAINREKLIYNRENPQKCFQETTPLEQRILDLHERAFTVEIYPPDLSLKDQIMGMYQETKKRMRGVGLE